MHYQAKHRILINHKSRKEGPCCIPKQFYNVRYTTCVHTFRKIFKDLHWKICEKLIIDIDNVENVAKKFENCRNWIKATQLNIFGKFQGSEVKAFAVYYTKYILHSQICDLFVIANNQFGFPVLVSYNFDISDG